MAAISNKAASEPRRAKPNRRSQSTSRRAAPILHRRAQRKTLRRGDAPLDIEGSDNAEHLYEARPARSLSSAHGAGGDLGGTVKKNRPPTSFLALYFRDMAALDVLQPEEELTAAQQIEALELDVWAIILCHPPMLERALAVIEANMGDSHPEFAPLRRAATEVRKSGAKAHAKLSRAARKCAAKLREADTDRQCMEAVLADIQQSERGETRGTASRQAISTESAELRAYQDRVRSAAHLAAEARNAFVKANLRLVVSIARRFNHGRMALADLIQEGNLGLIKAVERYDYRRGFRFSTYASWWIRHAISRALADKGREVRLPVHLIDAQHRLSKAKRELTSQLGRQPTSEELAEETQMNTSKIEKLRTYVLEQPFSLDKPVNDEDGRAFVDFLPDENIESPTELLALDAVTAEMRHMLLELKPIEAAILRQRFGLDDDQEMTLKQIGEKYNLSRERIRQLQEQALTKMRRALQRKDIMQ